MSETEPKTQELLIKVPSKTEKEMIKEFQEFRRKHTMTCNAIRLDEVAQFVSYKFGGLIAQIENRAKFYQKLANKTVQVKRQYFQGEADAFNEVLGLLESKEASE